MYMTAAFLLFFCAIIACLITGVPLLAAFCAGFILFTAAAVLGGASPKKLFRAMKLELRECMTVVWIMLLIGAVSGLWRAGGTITFFVYYGVRLITPPLFLLAAFLLSCVVSYALGSAFGVSGTIGVVFMALARSGGVNVALTAGAVLSGVFFGDRCSPASGCANLVAGITRTPIYDNIRHMMKTGLPALLISVVFYGALSVLNPIAVIDAEMLSTLQGSFNISALCALPAVFMLVLPLFKVRAIHALSVNVVVSFLCTVLLQKTDAASALRFALSGFSISGPLSAVLGGGGVISMVSATCIIMIAGTFGGIFRETSTLYHVGGRLRRLAGKIGLLPAFILSSAAVSGIFCNQTTSVIMQRKVWEDIYREHKISPEIMASDLSNSVAVIAGLVPWCTACSVPLSMLGVGTQALIFAVYLYAIPITYMIAGRRFAIGSKLSRAARPKRV